MVSVNQFLDLLRRTLLAGLLATLIWVPGLLPAIADSEVPVAKDDRLGALVRCLPTELSQPNFKRMWSEMGNDQIQRILHLTATPKLSQAEIELADCMSRQGFASLE